MQFQNPQDGSIKIEAMPMLGSLILGPLYFLISGLWPFALLWFALILTEGGLLGESNAYWIAVVVTHIIFVAATPAIIRRKYKNKDGKKCSSGINKHQQKQTK